ncbi:hypothetical protein [Micromonospora chersina]|uniref:hypothetical protein n=1 Tax=Micromonospora chersina TaxID=47854 RepID=UPI003D8C670C
MSGITRTLLCRHSLPRLVRGSGLVEHTRYRVERGTRSDESERIPYQLGLGLAEHHGDRHDRDEPPEDRPPDGDQQRHAHGGQQQGAGHPARRFCKKIEA